MINKEHQKLKKDNSRRVIVNIPNDLDQFYRKLAVRRGIKKSQMILFAMSWYLDHCNFR